MVLVQHDGAYPYQVPADWFPLLPERTNNVGPEYSTEQINQLWKKYQRVNYVFNFALVCNK